MSDIALPPRIVAYGQALARLAERLRAALAEPPPFFPPTAPTLTTLQQHLDLLEQAAHAIPRRLEATNNALLANEMAAEADAYRAAALLEAEIDRLLAGRAEVFHLDSPLLVGDAHDWLPRIYDHTLCEVLDWIDAFVSFVEAPRTTLEARGLWREGQPITVEVELKLTSAPELKALAAWLEKLIEEDDIDALLALGATEPARPRLFVPDRFQVSTRHMSTSAPGCLDSLVGLVWSLVKLLFWLFVIAFIVSLF